MLHALSIWLLVAAFAAAGLINARGAPAGKSNFARWGYPDWWRHLAGGLEMTAAALIALPAVREAGLILGAAIIAAAILTIFASPRLFAPRPARRLCRAACDCASFVLMGETVDVQDHDFAGSPPRYAQE